MKHKLLPDQKTWESWSSRVRCTNVSGGSYRLDEYTRNDLKGDRPKAFPCLVVWWFEDGFDRFGSNGVRIYDFIYPKEFKSSF